MSTQKIDNYVKHIHNKGELNFMKNYFIIRTARDYKKLEEFENEEIIFENVIFKNKKCYLLFQTSNGTNIFVKENHFVLSGKAEWDPSPFTVFRFLINRCKCCGKPIQLIFEYKEQALLKSESN